MLKMARTSIRIINELRTFMHKKASISSFRNEELKEIPVRKGLPLIGTSLSILASGSAPKLHLHIDNGHKSLGPIFKEHMGPTSAVFVSNPSLMRQVFKMEGKYPKHFLPQPWTTFNDIHSCKRGLFFMDGEEWLYHRRLMNKHFLKNDIIVSLKHVHFAVVQRLINRWQEFNGTIINDIEQEFYRHSISFLLGSLLGSSYIKDIDYYERDVERLSLIFYTIFETTSKLSGMPVNIMAKLSLTPWKNFEASVQSSLDACYELVEKMVKRRSRDGLLDKILNENLPLNIVVAIVVDLILAAGDTTAVTSLWSLYLLSGHKDVQLSISKAELDVKHVIKEALRLYPPAIFISRTMPEDTNISGYLIPQNELVLLSLYTVGRNNEIYPSANHFKPERWIRFESGRGYEGVTDPRAFFPFALGSRACIGKNLASAQLHWTISEILSAFDLELEEEVDMVLRLVPVPLQPVRIKIKSKK